MKNETTASLGDNAKVISNIVNTKHFSKFVDDNGVSITPTMNKKTKR